MKKFEQQMDEFLESIDLSKDDIEKR